MTKKISSGQCLCGNVQISITGKPKFSVQCYCRDCQRISGGGHLPQSAFEKININISGEVKRHQWMSDAGNNLELGNCTNCGSPIYKSTSKLPDVFFIPVGLLSDQTVFTSPHLAYSDNCQSWDTLSASNETEIV